MPKELIPAGWLSQPCVFLLPPSCPSAEVCGECERGFSWWRNGGRHCMFCGHLFHRQDCTRKVRVRGEFFKQRICSRCHYYRNTAQKKLQEGEEFDCVSLQHNTVDGKGSTMHISLCEETAELILNWKTKKLKETADLALAEVRKGFSHMHRRVETAGGNYEPLQSFSLFLKDGTGEQCAYRLKASSALICQLWVEGLKAAGYVYHKMVEQEYALRFYLDKNMKVSPGRWFSKPYLPRSSPLHPSSPDSEEWEELSSPSADTWGQSARYPATTPTSPYGNSSGYQSDLSPYGNSSGYQSDLSMSICSNVVLPRQTLTVHSFNFSRSSTASRKPHSLPPTPLFPPMQPSTTRSLPPTPGLSNTQESTCPCHFRVVPSLRMPQQSHSSAKFNSAPDGCCDKCKTSCQLALDI